MGEEGEGGRVIIPDVPSYPLPFHLGGSEGDRFLQQFPIYRAMFLDHHQTPDQNVSAASLCFDYVLKKNSALAREEDKKEALERIVRVVVETDHFKELFWDNPTADYHEFSLLGVLEGVKIEKPGDDTYAINFGFECLDALIRNFENQTRFT